jgi:putative ABC transport system permease protein
VKFAGSAKASAETVSLFDRETKDATLFVDQLKLLEKSLRYAMTSRNEMLILMGSFALLALVLTLTRIYGILPYFVAARTREIGIRLAMGANAGTLIKLVMKQALWIVMIGITADLMAAFGLSRYYSSQLFGIT